MEEEYKDIAKWWLAREHKEDVCPFSKTKSASKRPECRSVCHEIFSKTNPDSIFTVDRCPCSVYGYDSAYVVRRIKKIFNL